MYLQLYFISALVVMVVCIDELIFVYDWPEITNLIDNSTYEHRIKEHSKRYINHGAGPLLNASMGTYSTDQYMLFWFFYNRALVDPRRTLDPEKATTFLIPYDIGNLA